MQQTKNLPKIIEGNIYIDDRGQVGFVNDFDFSKYKIKRFYIVENHQNNFIRAWHGHKKENKYCMVVKGTVLFGAVEIDNWQNPSKDICINKFILSEKKSQILYIPHGYANGFMNLTTDAKVIIFSSSTIEESKNDDFRFEYNYWNIWEKNYR